MLKFGDLDSKFSKTNNEFEISTFEIGYMQNFVKIEKLPKMPKFEGLGSKFSKTNKKFEISRFKTEYMRDFVKIRKLVPFGTKCPNLGSKFEKRKLEENSRFPQF